MPEVRVRFAPSPTGFLHIGSARTAFFNWLYARHEGGKFFLRIEDTDKERSKTEFLEEILDSLKWLGLSWEEPLVYQSRRTEHYRTLAQRLLGVGLAHREGGSDGAILFRMPKSGKLGFDDLLHGRIEFDLAQHVSLTEDLVIFKSDGSPTYNFAVVCDDADMGITHVIRGDDHISNTPKQLSLYQALGFRQPVFCHIPLILGEDRSRMSKRHGATSIREYRQAGYLPEAVVNYLSLLGWSPGNNQELMSRSELVEKFTLKRVLKTGAIFNKEKLEWMNKQYLKQLPASDLTDRLMPYLREKGYWPSSGRDRDWLERLVKLYQERIGKLSDFVEMAAFFFKDSIEYSESVVEEIKKHPRALEVIGAYDEVIKGLENFEVKTIEAGTGAFLKNNNLTNKEFIHPYRLILTGQGSSPGFYDTVSLIGQPQCLKRLEFAAQQLLR